MKPVKIQFNYWVCSFIHGNSYLHLPIARSSLHRMSSLSANPADVAHFDTRAAELLTKARAAHDELTAYLQSRTDNVGEP